MRVRVNSRVVLDTDDEELARITYSLRRGGSRAGSRVEMIDGAGAVVASHVVERRLVYRAVRPPRQGSLF